MGYYTDYTIRVSPVTAAEINADLESFQALFEELTGYQLDDEFQLYGVKWYEHEKNMIELSKLYPTAVWQLDGVGEEEGDVWRVYFKNGKKQDANTQVIVTHEDFDESKLR